MERVMVTFVGDQKNFGSAVKSLIELEYDASSAYQISIEKIYNKDFKNKLTEFKHDHERHVKELLELIEKHGEEAPKEADTKEWLTKGKVVLGSLIGDEAILRAMNSNEIDTNTAYERMCLREDAWKDSIKLLKSFLQDERKHKLWLEETIKLA